DPCSAPSAAGWIKPPWKQRRPPPEVAGGGRRVRPVRRVGGGDQRPSDFFTAAAPGWPSVVVTPSSQASSTAGLAFSQAAAPLLPSLSLSPADAMTVDSVGSVNFRLAGSLPRLGHSVL